MTTDPMVVYMNDPANEALGSMIENHYRYLPVVDSDGNISGLLDIGKCIHDAMTKLERSVNRSSSSAENQVSQMIASNGGDRNQAMLLSKLLTPIMSQAFKNKSTPTLRNLLAGKPATGNSVAPTSSILVAGILMAEKHKAALVVEDDQLVGIVSFKDVVTRAIAKKLPLETTEVTTIMTADPEFVTPDTTVVEAMQIMHDSNFLTLPVCEEDGTVCGVIDVMDLIYGAGGAEGWRSIFDNALEMDDLSDSRSAYSAGSISLHQDEVVAPIFLEPKQEPVIHVMNSPYASAVLNNVPNHVVFQEGEQESLGDSLLDRTLSYPVASTPDRPPRVSGNQIFKIIDAEGHKYLVRSDAVYKNLLNSVAEKIDGITDKNTIRLKFIDEEGDAINVNDNDCLEEAIDTARRNGDKGVKLMLSIHKNKGKSSDLDTSKLAMIGGGIALVLGASVIALLRPRK